MRIAVLDEAGVVQNIIIADGEAVLPELGISNYRALMDGEPCEIGLPIPVPVSPAE